MSGLSGALGAVSKVAGAIGEMTSLGDLGALPSTGGLAAPVVGDSNLSDEQFIDLVAVLFAGCPFPTQTAKVGSMWKANYKSYATDADDVKYLNELGVVSTPDPAALTKADKQFIALWSLVVSASGRKAAEVEADWKPTRDGFRTVANLKFFRDLGFIG